MDDGKIVTEGTYETIKETEEYGEIKRSITEEAEKQLAKEKKKKAEKEKGDEGSAGIIAKILEGEPKLTKKRSSQSPSLQKKLSGLEELAKDELC